MGSTEINEDEDEGGDEDKLEGVELTSGDEQPQSYGAELPEGATLGPAPQQAAPQSYGAELPEGAKLGPAPSHADEPESSTFGASARGILRGLIPGAAGGLAGLAAGSAATPLLTPVGGVAAGLGAGALVGGATRKLQDEITDALGLDSPEQREADVKQHPYATTAAETAAGLTTFSPVAAGKDLTQRLVQRALSGGIMGGVDVGTQYATTGKVDPTQAAIAAAGGAAMPGVRDWAGSALGRVGVNIHARPGADEPTPEATAERDAASKAGQSTPGSTSVGTSSDMAPPLGAAPGGDVYLKGDWMTKAADRREGKQAAGDTGVVQLAPGEVSEELKTALKVRKAFDTNEDESQVYPGQGEPEQPEQPAPGQDLPPAWEMGRPDEPPVRPQKPVKAPTGEPGRGNLGGEQPFWMPGEDDQVQQPKAEGAHAPMDPNVPVPWEMGQPSNEEPFIPPGARRVMDIAAQKQAGGATKPTGQAHIDQLFQTPVLRQVMQHATPEDMVDRTKNIPFVAGATTDLNNPKIYIDSRVPKTLDVNGTPVDTTKPLLIHENVEQQAMARMVATREAKLGKPLTDKQMTKVYDEAHDKYATPAEEAYVRSLGVDVDAYNQAWKPITEAIGKEPAPHPPQDLYLAPYPKTMQKKLENRGVEGALQPQPEQGVPPGNLGGEGVGGQKENLQVPDAKPARSLFEHLAANGGMKPSGELKTIIGSNKKLAPRIGALISKNGMDLDQALQVAKDGKYLIDAGEIQGGEQSLGHNDLLDLMDAEARGTKQYPVGHEGPAPKADPGRDLHELGQYLDHQLKENGVDPHTVPDDIHDRAVDLMSQGERDPLAAYERAAMETPEKEEKFQITPEITNEKLKKFGYTDRQIAAMPEQQKRYVLGKGVLAKAVNDPEYKAKLEAQERALDEQEKAAAAKAAGEPEQEKTTAKAIADAGEIPEFLRREKPQPTAHSLSAGAGDPASMSYRQPGAGAEKAKWSGGLQKVLDTANAALSRIMRTPRLIFAPETISDFGRKLDTIIRGVSGPTKARILEHMETLKKTLDDVGTHIQKLPADIRNEAFKNYEAGRVPADSPLANWGKQAYKIAQLHDKELREARGEGEYAGALASMFERPKAGEDLVKDFIDQFRQENKRNPTIGEVIDGGEGQFKLRDEFVDADGSVNLMTAFNHQQYLKSKIVEKNRIIDEARNTQIGGKDGPMLLTERDGPGLEKIDPRLTNNVPLYAPVEAKTVLERYLNPYSSDKPVKNLLEGAMYLKNASNSWNLAVDSYHLSFMLQEAIGSAVARGFGRMRDNPSAGVKDIMGAITAPYSLYKSGKRGVLDQIKNGTVEEGSPIDYMRRANHQFGRSHGSEITPELETGFMKNYVNAFKPAFEQYKHDLVQRGLKAGNKLGEGDLGGAAKHAGLAAVESFTRGMQLLMHPLFNDYIPNLKNGAVYENMRAYMEDHKGETPEHYTEVAKRFTKTADNAMGELNQQMLYWPPLLKFAGNMATVSLGWNVGNVRQIGSAVGSLVRSKGAAAFTHSPDFNPAIPSLMAGAFVMATGNMIYQLMKTGELPKSFSDVVAPRTGGKAARSQQPERAILPGYEKDWLEYINAAGGPQSLTKAGLHIAYNKLATLWKSMIDIGMNEDWADKVITNQNKGVAQHLKDYSGYLLKNIGTPIIAQNFMRQGLNKQSEISTPEALMGIKHAPQQWEKPQQYLNNVRKQNEKDAKESKKFHERIGY